MITKSSSLFAGCPLMLVDTSGCEGFQETVAGGSKINEGETHLVLALIRRHLTNGLVEQDIAVITPYNKQVHAVRALVNHQYPDIEVQTVDAFQGREKEAVILTLVRANYEGTLFFKLSFLT